MKIEGTFYGKPLSINVESKEDIEIEYTDTMGAKAYYFPCEEDCDGIIAMLEDKDIEDKITGLGTLMLNWNYPIYNIPSTDKLTDILTKLTDIERDYQLKELPCDIVTYVDKAIGYVEDAIEDLKEVITIRKVLSDAHTFRWTEGHGKSPKYAVCNILDGNGDEKNVLIKLSAYAEGDDKDKIFHFCENGVEELSSLCRWDSCAGFKVISVRYTNEM